ncbi:MAG TPA: hypothetical protein VFZ09_24920 [Archangium sp.]|uniref:hypothetical protein n=1 Tax=Archangium sp. TaxID=1872627 RepID=UPI002E368082|nr:hypothetical protein [Archangium sp.]HEX5749495.1 hypothetical protein [Archangium sp.]
MSAPRVRSAPLLLRMRGGWPRAKHVIKHLYRPGERWDLLVPGLPTGLRERALAAGCSCLQRIQNGSDRPERLSSPCARLVQADHEAYYAPAYMHAAETSLAGQRDGVLGNGRRALVGDNGVLVIASDGSDGRPDRVLSAYRPILGHPETRTAEEIREAAFQLWSDKTALAGAPLPEDTEEP